MSSEQASASPGAPRIPLWRTVGMDFFFMYGVVAFCITLGNVVDSSATFPYIPLVTGVLFALSMLPERRRARAREGQ